MTTQLQNNPSIVSIVIDNGDDPTLATVTITQGTGVQWIVRGTFEHGMDTEQGEQSLEAFKVAEAKLDPLPEVGEKFTPPQI